MKKHLSCLVTGGAGFIGSNLALELEKMGHSVTIIDNFASGYKENIKTFKGKVIEGDVSKKREYSKYDVIFHQAAITDPRFPNNEETLNNNINGFRLMMNLAKKSGAKLIYASTASLYGNTKAPQKEEQEKQLLSAYAQSKLIADEMATYHFDKMHIIGLRYFNVFGPGEENKGKPASMVYHLLKQMKKGKKPRLFKSGQHKRDFVYVKDCVLANIKALNAKSGIYNVGTGISTSFNELVSIINKVLGTNLGIKYFDMPYNPKTYQNNTQANTVLAESILNFKSSYPIKEAIKEYSEIIK